MDGGDSISLVTGDTDFSLVGTDKVLLVCDKIILLIDSVKFIIVLLVCGAKVLLVCC